MPEIARRPAPDAAPSPSAGGRSAAGASQHEAARGRGQAARAAAATTVAAAAGGQPLPAGALTATLARAVRERSLSPQDAFGLLPRAPATGVQRTCPTCSGRLPAAGAPCAGCIAPDAAGDDVERASRRGAVRRLARVEESQPVDHLRPPARLSIAPFAAGPVLQRAVSEVCNPPSMWLALAGSAAAVPMSAAFGLVAEKLISASVLKTNAVAPANAYLDNPLAGPIDPGLVRFVLAKNPALGVAQRLLVASSSVARPDVIMHQPPILEFEEIKPDSAAGRAAGRAKLRAIAAFYASIPLPYAAGTTYVPPPPLVLVNGTVTVPVVGAVPLKVSFRISRDRAGLLVYDICVETDWVKAAASVLLLIAAIIALILSRGRLGRIPMPRPVPVPVLALGTSGEGSVGVGLEEGLEIAALDVEMVDAAAAPTGAEEAATA